MPTIRKLGDQIVDVDTTDPKGIAWTKVPHVLAFLRQRQFGTRTHLFVEILLDTKGRPEQVRQIDLGDIDYEAQRVVVGVPETHLVSSSGLLTDRVANLSTTTLDALETYTEYERNEPEYSCGGDPLFTTHNGRASSGTLRRSIKIASTNASPESADESGPVLPNDIWQYAMSEILNQQ
ncbi:hypothetical protein HARCEL1_12705 [Halococcoides cellulosivorans]|uniref:Uncharacterized protein n=1 Tax=Halococcoides cellulosivorans TaxID=1679096 RepID=A0A2R4X3Y4_9EURY|nr:hypothetical protein HARCEL1_12705 [Halococcoides cellulosivorans]